MSWIDRLNYQLYRLKFRYGQYLPLSKPVDVSLELSSTCNQQCGYCYHADQKNLPFVKGFMEWETAEKIICESAELGVHSLKFNWKGESTLNPIFPRATALAKSLSTRSTFIDRLTNSNFKFANNKEEIFEGLSNQTKVKISFDSFIKEVLEKQRKGANYELALANIDKFYNHPLRILSNTEIVIQAVRTQLNKDEDIYGEVKKRWPNAHVSIRDMVTGRVGRDLHSLEVRELGSERQSCLQAHVRLIFNHRGVSSACCPDIREQIQLGDINKQSLRSIFLSEQAKALRKSLKDKSAFENDPCKTCSSYESYKGFIPNWQS